MNDNFNIVDTPVNGGPGIEQIDDTPGATPAAQRDIGSIPKPKFDEDLDDQDKTNADSFPASDPPSY